MYDFATAICQPFTFALLATLVGALWTWQVKAQSRLAIGFAMICATCLILCCTPGVSFLALRSLEGQFTSIKQRPADAPAIVVLGGYLFPTNDLNPRPMLAPDTLQRCLQAAHLYHQSAPCLVICSGDVSNSSDAQGIDLAQAMRDFLMDLDVAPEDVLTESRSTSTYENAVETTKLLRERGIEKIVLVTHATHMLRAEACFQEQGIEVAPAPCIFFTGDFDWDYTAFLPSAEAAIGVNVAAHEWLGLTWYWLKGRI